jgi:hypothetical protein
LAHELGLERQDPGVAAQRIARHLRDGFRYSTAGFRPVDGMTPLVQFLMRERAGHCEYFATATVQLLRVAGVPARYATGFSLQEYDAGAGRYLVRERHAHAWARAWLDGRWVDIDTTPADWARTEDLGRGSVLRARAWLTDAWSGLRYRYARWQMQGDDWQKWGLAGGIGALVLAWLLWRVFGVGSARRAREGAAHVSPAPAAVPGADSAFFGILHWLARHHAGRRDDETVQAWLARLGTRGPAMPQAAELRRLAGLHYRLRFDPACDHAPTRDALRRGCAAWLAAAQAGQNADGPTPTGWPR